MNTSSYSRLPTDDQPIEKTLQPASVYATSRVHIPSQRGTRSSSPPPYRPHPHYASDHQFNDRRKKGILQQGMENYRHNVKVYKRSVKELFRTSPRPTTCRYCRPNTNNRAVYPPFHNVPPYSPK